MIKNLRARRLTDFDLKLLSVFTTIVDCHGVSSAALELNVDRSSVSKQLADLEVRLGLRLCDRGRTGFALTAEGREVYLAACDLFRDIDSFGARMAAMRTRLSGPFHLAIADGVVANPACRLPDVLARFHERAPNVHVVITVSSANAIERGLLGDAFDIGFVPYHHGVEGLDHVDLFSEHAQLYCGFGHPFHARDPGRIELSEIASAPYVDWGYAIDPALIDPRLRVTPAATVYNNEGAVALVLSGQYLGFLPVHFAREWEAGGAIKPIRTDIAHYTKPIAMLWGQRRAQEVLIELFVTACRAAHAATDSRG